MLSFLLGKIHLSGIAGPNDKCMFNLIANCLWEDVLTEHKNSMEALAGFGAVDKA